LDKEKIAFFFNFCALSAAKGRTLIMIEQIKIRRSIRRYLDKPVEDVKIIQLIESARLAPSGDNSQPWHFIVIKSELIRNKLAEVSKNQKWMLTAPVFIACVADIRSRINDDREISLNENSPLVGTKVDYQRYSHCRRAYCT